MTRSTVFKTLALLAVSCCAWSDTPAANQPTPAGIEFFEAKIRPVLAANCYPCHSGAAKQVMGGLYLDSRNGMLKGGASGPAIVPGQARGSSLIRAIRYDNRQMPPVAKLPESVIADFEKWVAMGAPDPREGQMADWKRSNIDVEKGRKFWAFQPVQKPVIPKVSNAKWSSQAIDRFLLARMEEKRVAPVADADRATWLRRVTLDLTGLPPTLREIDGFQNDRSRDAYANVVDRLLASERFGERWGRHWLDVARYAESVGPGRNYVLPFAWRYRDYVIEAFNKDKPYDQFVKEQIAGDLLPSNSPKQHSEQVTATGFLTLGSANLIENNAAIFRMDIVGDQINVTTRSFLALSVGCARCHDHKFDPIPTTDYYALAGIFRSTEILSGVQRNPRDNASYFNANLLAKIGNLPEPPNQDHDPGKLKRWEELQAQVTTILAKKKGPGVNLRDETKALLAELDGLPLPLDLVMAVRDSKEIADCEVNISGEVKQLGPAVPRGFVQVVGRPGEKTQIGPNESGRLQLAEWLGRRDNPLTARVAVNRIWHHMFGRGLVATLDNFGATGEKPSHPELLDYLAARFMDQGWSVKKMIREIALSRAYRLGTANEATQAKVDPDNTLLWRMNRRRLEVEAIRDSVLMISGQIDLRPPPSPVLGLSRRFDLDSVKYKPPCDYSLTMRNRSVYVPVLRNFIPSMFEVFDFPEPSETKGRREVTTVPMQALFMMNSAFVIEQSKHAAEKLLAGGAENAQHRIGRVYREVLGRAPSAEEVKWSIEFVKASPTASDTGRTAWGRLYQALFASAEFRYRS